MAKDFHKDMAGYLDNRLGDKKHFSDVFKKKHDIEFKEIDEVEEELQQMDQEAEEYDQPKKSFLSRIFGRSKDEDMEDVDMEDSMPTLDEDVKKVLRISFDWINQLPPDKKVKFKHSQDFVEYKAVLKKYGLLKETKEVEYAQKT